jgi:hypothetical protein
VAEELVVWLQAWHRWLFASVEGEFRSDFNIIDLHAHRRCCRAVELRVVLELRFSARST